MPSPIHMPPALPPLSDRERQYVIDMLEIYAVALRGGQIDPRTVAAGLDEVRTNVAKVRTP